MTEDQDKRIAALFGAVAPPARDPLFRVGVLERRERQQFQRRAWTMLAGVLLIILVSSFAIAISRGRPIGGGVLVTTGALVVGTALASGYLAFRGWLLRTFRRFKFNAL